MRVDGRRGETSIGANRAAAGIALALYGCGSQPVPVVATDGAPPAALEASASARRPDVATRVFALPGAVPPASLDLFGFEPSRSRIWVPVPATGSVDVLDLQAGTFIRVDGFRTTQREWRGTMHVVGPNGAAAGGNGAVYVGKRATNELCAVDAASLRLAGCAKLSAAPDGVAYVGAAQQVWVTLPEAGELAVLDTSSPLQPFVRTTIGVEGEPEGYASDEARGVFFANLEDKGVTLAIDVSTRKVSARFHPRCNADGPRGVVFDPRHDFLVVACTDHLQVLDVAHGGALLGQLATGAGVDNIDFARGQVYAAAGKAATLTIADLDDGGELTVAATFPTSPGARNVVADNSGHAFVADSKQARELVFDVSR